MSTVANSDRRSSLELLGGKIDPLIVVAVAVVLGPLPLAWLHLRSLWLKEQYQYFPFVIGAVIFFLVTRWQQAPRVETPPRWPALPWLAVGCSGVLLAGAVLTVSGWLAFVSMNVGLAAVFWWLGSRRRIRGLWMIWCLLWLMVPPPLQVDERFVSWLQGLSSRLSSAVLDMTGILHVMSGNVLTLSNKELFVDEACSGIVSVMSIVACSLIYGIYRNRSVIHLILLTCMGVCWAVIMNTVRICVIAMALQHWGVDWSQGTSHEMLGLILFLTTFVALVSSDYLLAAMLSPIDSKNVGRVSRDALVRLWNWLLAPEHIPATAADKVAASNGPNVSGPIIAERGAIRPLGAVVAATAFACLAIVQFVWVPSPESAVAQAAIDRALAIEENFLPQKIGVWEREEFEAVEREAYSDFGRYSRSFTYRHTQRPALRAKLSLDFPYIGGWHDLCMCYRGNGWKTQVRDVTTDAGKGSDWRFVAAELEDATGVRASVNYTGFDVSGAAAEPPTSAVLFRPWFRLRRRLLRQIVPQLFQVQVFAVGDSVLDEAAQHDLRDLLLNARVCFRDYVVDGKSESPYMSRAGLRAN